MNDQELLERIIAPIKGDLPAGPDLRDDTSTQSIYSRLRDARAEARAEERALDNNLPGDARAQPGWTIVETLSIEALCVHGKDIEIACWLTECLTRRRGLDGLAFGATVIASLVEHYWET